MKVQRLRLSNDKISWTVLDNRHQAIAPINDFLTSQQALGRSPNTIRAYAHHLRRWWEYLDGADQKDWQTISRADIADFINGLRARKSRQSSTINAIVAAVISFYDYQDQAAEYHTRFGSRSKRHQFVHSMANRNRPFAQPISKRPPETLTKEQVLTLITACQLKRDKLLLTLLYQTGMRIGQALGLRHEDIDSEDNLIRIVPRDDNANGMRAKTRHEYIVHISTHLITLYTDYLVNEYPDMDSDYVFVALFGQSRGRPLTYHSVVSLFNRLGRKTDIVTHPHAFRHTHVTELLQAGIEPRIIQQRVGHQSINTTMENYAHLTATDVKREFQRAQIL